MKIVFLADLHIDNYQQFGGPQEGGVNQRAEYILATIRRAMELGDKVVILGDIFNKSKPPPVLIYRMQAALACAYDVCVIPGNHDMDSDAIGNNAVAPLSMSYSTVHQRPACWFNVIVVPFQVGSPESWLPNAIEEALSGLSTAPRVLATHFGISDDSTPYHLDNSSGHINVNKLVQICKRYGISFVFSGDWHRHQRWDIDGVTVVQVGALCPNRFPPQYEQASIGPAVVLDNGEVSMVNVPGPRFYKLNFTKVRREGWTIPSDALPAYIRLKHRLEDTQEAKEWASALQVEHKLSERAGIFGGLDFEVDRGIEVIKAHAASFEARQASSLEEAVQRYVAKMPVPTNVSREMVLDNVQRLLSGA